MALGLLFELFFPCQSSAVTILKQELNILSAWHAFSQLTLVPGKNFKLDGFGVSCV
jgi:hypothetical protein